MTKRLAVSIGCPSGIGPEVCVVAAAKHVDELLLVGDVGAITASAIGRKVRKKIVRVDDPRAARVVRGAIAVWQPTRDLSAKDRAPGKPSRAGGAAQLAWIDAACDLVTRGTCAALVTGPVSKEAIVRSKAKGSAGFIGHTEHLEARLGAPYSVMTFWSEELTTSLVTTHLALADVPRAITREGVANATTELARFLRVLVPKSKVVRIAVASLNPHAGEGGLFGDEEARAIAPGIALARKRTRALAKLQIEGPVPAETAFRRAVAKTYDGVVAMYHDQATIPMKCVAFGEAVNVTLGLPIVRTSVDHGTGYDIAGKWRADAAGIEAAIVLAQRMLRPANTKRESER